MIIRSAKSNIGKFDQLYINESDKNAWCSNFTFFLVLCVFFLCFISLLLYNISATIDNAILACQIAIMFAIILFSKIIISRRVLILTIINLIAGMTNILLNGSGVGTFFACGIINIVSIISRRLIFDKKQLRILFAWAATLLWLIIALYSRRDNVYFYCIIPSLSSIRYNPNGMAIIIFLATVFSMSLVETSNTDLTLKFIMGLFILTVGGFFIYHTAARTSLIALIIYAFFLFVKMKRGFNARTTQRCLYICVGLSLLVTIGYVMLYNIIGDIQILGKNLFTGRQNIWMEAWGLIKNNFFIGFSNNHMYMGVFQNAHNTFLALLGNMGIIPFILTIYFMVTSVSSNTKHLTACIGAIIALMFTSTFEIVYTETHFVLLVMLLYLTSSVGTRIRR